MRSGTSYRSPGRPRPERRSSRSSPSPLPRPADQRLIVQLSGVADRLEPRPARVPAPVGQVVEHACDWAGVPPDLDPETGPGLGHHPLPGMPGGPDCREAGGPRGPGRVPDRDTDARPGPRGRRAAARAGRAGRWTGVVVRRSGGGPLPSQWPWEGWSACTEGDPTVGRGIVSWVDTMETWRPTVAAP
jgi:hypothetical protein